MDDTTQPQIGSELSPEEQQRQQIEAWQRPLAEAAEAAYKASKKNAKSPPDWMAVSIAVLEQWERQVGNQILVPYGYHAEGAIIRGDAPVMAAVSEVVAAQSFFPNLPQHEGVAVFVNQVQGRMDALTLDIVFHDAITKQEHHFTIEVHMLVRALAFERLKQVVGAQQGGGDGNPS